MSNLLRNEVLREIKYVQSVGAKIFLCPFIGRTKSQMIGFYIMRVLMQCTIIQLFVTLITDGSKDWLEIVNVAPNLGVIIMAYIKYTTVDAYKKIYEEVFHHFREDFWDIVEAQNEGHQKILKKYKWVVTAINRFLVFYSIPLILMVDSIPYFFMKYEKRVHGDELFLYPYDAWYPFDKLKWYAVAYIWESFMTATVVAVFGITDVIHASYVGFTCMELKLLGNCLEEIISPDDVANLCDERNSNEIHRNVVRKLKIIIAKHNFLAKISSELDIILGDAMLFNYFIGSIFICLTAFTFTVVDVSYKRMRYFLMFMSFIIEIFNQCLLGQVLTDHSKYITKAIYFSDWPYASPEAKKLMLMFIMWTQKPFELTGKGYIVMNMNSYSSICSTSYQCYNLLRTVFQ
ncbi:odorant receptor 13a-like [Bicyclus anynana]|uniref:Odorant receptor n=1 Tax=Bicyclus anynana TaxID=110368 RepID=A0ABM3LJX1_BICAN|nr:odorant receptor 13a-like [Bicyclus anynana]